MKITEIRKKAGKMGLKTGRMNKAGMIRAIQIAEGNFPCFGTAKQYCDRVNCCWRKDCLHEIG